MRNDRKRNDRKRQTYIKGETARKGQGGRYILRQKYRQTEKRTDKKIYMNVKVNSMLNENSKRGRDR